MIQVVTPPSHSLDVGGATAIEAETFNMVAIYDDDIDVTSSASWSIISGNQYATIAVDGTVTIDSSADENSVVIQATYNGLSATQTVVVTYKSGSSSHTDIEVVVDPETGNTTTTTTTTTENEDGSSSSSSQSTTYDENGNTVGSQTNETTTNADGSGTSTTTNYNENGVPVSGENEVTDTDNNKSTQSVEYDETGSTTVTGYDIDTSGNPDGEKTFNGDGVNTQFYAFDVTRGFIMNMHFVIDFSQQPAGQHENHHNILTMKRATPEPWFGFQLRQTGTNKYVILGTQFATGNNLNTNLPVGRQISTNVVEYDVEVVYDPTLSSNQFVARELISDTTILSSSSLFPDLPELRYLTVCIGYALDANGDPYRYSNIDVYNFSIQKIVYELEEPEVACDGKHITLTCTTPNAVIYYRLDEVGAFAVYSEPIDIFADTVVETYSYLNGETSETVTETCIYDPGHDYSSDYLTFDIITSGTVKWNLIGTTQKTIEYSLNEGEWTSITASSSTEITVTAGDEVRFRGLNVSYATDKSNYSGFEGGTAAFNVCGNIMSLIYGDNFIGQTTFNGGTYNFCSMFKLSNVMSAENLILPATTLRQYCYRAMFSKDSSLTVAPALPATTLANGCYYYMFEECGIQTAPELLATSLVSQCYYYMFTKCSNLNYVKCMATTNVTTTNCNGWLGNVSAIGTFVKDANTTWTRGTAGIPNNWTIVDV